jgi:Tol biopolymer transport system component
LETLVTVPFYGTRPHWSPAGDRIVFVGADTSATNMEGVWTIRPDGSEVTKIADETVLQTRPTPRFSPNGEWIALDFAGDLHVVRADGTGMRQLTTSPSAAEWHFRWSPAGDRIAYVGDAGLFWEVRIMTFPEGALVGVVEGQGHVSFYDNVTYPEWSPDGERIAVMGLPSKVTAGGSTVANGPIATVRREDLSASASAPVTVVQPNGRLPQWWVGH